MPRLYAFVEGQTEQTFVNTVLKEHLSQYGVWVHGSVLIAHARKRGRVHRGGGRKYQPMRNDILRFLKQERKPDVFFTSMIDLYGIHSDFPGMKDAEGLRGEPRKRVEFLERAFGADVDDERFIPYIQLHEYEAYLFSAPRYLEYFYDHHESAIAELVRVSESCKTPEDINEGQNTAPSKRIIAQLPDYDGAKPIVGPQVALLIGLTTIRQCCPHFNAWLTHLENL